MSKRQYKNQATFFNYCSYDTPDSVELRSGVWNRISYTIDDETKSGKLYQFMQFLDGSRNLSEITLLTHMPRSDGESIIDHLKQLNVLENGSSTAFDYYSEINSPTFKSKQLPNSEVETGKVFILADDELREEIRLSLNHKSLLKNIEVISDDDPIMNI